MAAREHSSRRDRALRWAALAGSGLACAAGVTATGVTGATLADTEAVLRVSVTGAVPEPPPGRARPETPLPAEDARSVAPTATPTRPEADQPTGSPPRTTKSPVTPPSTAIEQEQRREPAREPAAPGAAARTDDRQGAAATTEDCPKPDTPDGTCTGKEQSDETGG